MGILLPAAGGFFHNVSDVRRGIVLDFGVVGVELLQCELCGGDGSEFLCDKMQYSKYLDSKRARKGGDTSDCLIYSFLFNNKAPQK